MSIFEFFITYVLKKKQMSSQKGSLGINYEDFIKIVGKSCLVDQIRHSIFGLPLERNAFEPLSEQE